MGRIARRVIRRAQDESGQSLFLIIGAMVAILVVAALAIDLATWYQKHHQAQVSADAAALAAANCLANESSTNATDINTCTTPTDTSRASNVATTIAQRNTVPITGVTYGTNSSGTVTNVTVTTSTTTHSFFAGIAKVAAPNATAQAVASVTWNYQDCPNAGTGCLMFYAASNTCTSYPGAIDLQVGNSDTFNGGIFTNGSINDGSGNGGNFNAPVTYGATSACGTGSSGNSSFKGTFNDGSPVQQTTNRGSTTTPNWLIDYSADFPACSNSSTTTCNAQGTPGYCTYSAASFVTYLGAGVYCAYGTSITTKNNPSTWNGTIAFSSNGTYNATMIGGSVTLHSNSTYTPVSNGLLAYATGTSSTAFTANGGGLTFTGDVFVPNGGASILGGNVNFTSFLQAQTIVDNGGAQTGAGPSFSGGTTITGGQDTLSQ